jgi:hypothetical protein
MRFVCLDTGVETLGIIRLGLRGVDAIQPVRAPAIFVGGDLAG